MRQLVANFGGAIPLLFVSGAVALVAAARLAYVRSQRGEPYPAALARSILDAAVALMIFDIVVITLMTHGPKFRKIQLIPLEELRRVLLDSARPGRALVLANFALFLPFGALLPLRFRKLDRFWVMAALTASFSVVIEALQFAIGGHESSVDDVIANTASALAGMLAMRAARAAFRAARARRPSAAADGG